MTNNTRNIQQNLDSQPKRKKYEQTPASKAARFKPGFDPRRWMQGRGKKSPEQKEGEEILLSVIWEELSRELDSNGNLLGTSETIDVLRAAVRKAIQKDFRTIMERIAGRVTEKVEMTVCDYEVDLNDE